MTKQYKGQIRVAGRTYECHVIDGVRYIDGKPSMNLIDQSIRLQE